MWRAVQIQRRVIRSGVILGLLLAAATLSGCVVDGGTPKPPSDGLYNDLGVDGSIGLVLDGRLQTLSSLPAGHHSSWSFLGGTGEPHCTVHPIFFYSGRELARIPPGLCADAGNSVPLSKYALAASPPAPPK
jgi:hypothetical protein